MLEGFIKATKSRKTPKTKFKPTTDICKIQRGINAATKNKTPNKRKISNFVDEKRQ